MGDVGDIIQEFKHLRSGDPEPVVDQNKYTLLAYRFCPYCERVRLVLSYHKVEYDSVWISLLSKPDWFVNKFPRGTVPVLLNQGNKLFESDFIMRFVDDLRGPSESLMAMCGLESFERAASLCGKFFRPAHTILYKPTYEEKTAAEFREACVELCSTLKKGYFESDRLSLADLLLFPMLDRLEVVLGVLVGTNPASVVQLKPNESHGNYPELVSYLDRLRHLPFVAAVRQPTHLHALFAAAMREGKADPDMRL